MLQTPCPRGFRHPRRHSGTIRVRFQSPARVNDFLLSYGLFLAKTLTLAGAVIAIVVAVASAVRQSRRPAEDRIEVRHINERLRHLAELLNQNLLGDREWKAELKRLKQEDKDREAADKRGDAPRPRLFVLDFDGDIEASRVDALREEITALLQVARSGDEVLLRLESPGGVVHGYGLAASQLRRLRDRGYRLTIAVDKVAASGGYMMACVADRIVAAPFAVLGSIGVVAMLPNFRRLLEKHEIDVEQHTAGEYKRTLSMFGENTEAARSKFRQELDETHALFKRFVLDNRPQLDLERIATGEHWYGTQALDLQLVDRLSTSDDLLLEAAQSSEVYEVRYKPRRSLRDQLVGGWLLALIRGLQKLRV